MNQQGIFKPVIIGILIAVMLVPVPAQAQWTVFDPANYGLQLRKQVEELNRWLETINQYTRMYENAVGQLTNLKGILKTADELLAQDKRLRSLMSNWGHLSTGSINWTGARMDEPLTSTGGTTGRRD